MPALKRAYRTRYASVRGAILDALISFGPEGKDVAEQLMLKDLKSKDFSTRACTVREYVRIGEAGKIPPSDLFRILESDQDFEVKAAEAAIIARGDKFHPELVARCISRKADQRNVYMELLRRFGSLAIAEVDLQMNGANGGPRDELLELRSALSSR